MDAFRELCEVTAAHIEARVQEQLIHSRLEAQAWRCLGPRLALAEGAIEWHGNTTTMLLATHPGSAEPWPINVESPLAELVQQHRIDLSAALGRHHDQRQTSDPEAPLYLSIHLITEPVHLVFAIVDVHNPVKEWLGTMAFIPETWLRANRP